MIQSINNNNSKTYVGYTTDIKKRIKLHNSGRGAKSTRGKTWKLIFSRKYNDKSNALKAEYRLKKNIKVRKMIKNGYKFKNNLCI